MLNIDIKTINYGILVKSHLEPEILFRQSILSNISLSYSKKDGCIFLREEKGANYTFSSSFIKNDYLGNPFKKRAILYLPEGMEADLSFNTLGGNIDLNNISINNLSIYSIYGNTKLEHAKIDKLKVNGIENDSKLNDVSGNSLEINTVTGSIGLYDIDFIDASISTKTGDITLEYVRKNSEGIGFNVNGISLFGEQKNDVKKLTLSDQFGQYKGSLFR